MLLHFFYHAGVLLGCVRHFLLLLLKLMLHLFGAQTFDYLVDDVGSMIHLVVVARGNLLLLRLVERLCLMSRWVSLK